MDDLLYGRDLVRFQSKKLFEKQKKKLNKALTRYNFKIN